MTASPKVQRWIDLLAALLGHRMPVTFEELAKDVPAYLTDGSVAARNPSPTLKCMFERDKLELRELGVPILSIGEDGSDESAYTLRTKDFYLPYLGIVAGRGIERPTTVDRYGYRSLETLGFEPDELEATVEGARRVAQVALALTLPREPAGTGGERPDQPSTGRFGHSVIRKIRSTPMR